MREFFRGFFNSNEDEKSRSSEVKPSKSLDEDKQLSRRDFLRGGKVGKPKTESGSIKLPLSEKVAETPSESNEENYYAEYIINEDETNVSSEQNDLALVNRPKSSGTTRRKVLQIMGKVTAGLIGGYTISKYAIPWADKTARSFQAQSRHNDFLKTGEDVEIRNNEVFKAYEHLLGILEEARQKLDISAAEYQGGKGEEKLRRDFLQMHGEEVKQFFDTVQKHVQEVRKTDVKKNNLQIFTEINKGIIGNILKDAYAQLAQFKVHGKVYAFLHSNQLYGQKDKILNGEDIGLLHFETRTEDFLPRFDELGAEDIEPENIWLNKIYPESFLANKGMQEVLKKDRKGTFWDKEFDKGVKNSKYLAKVNYFLSDRAVRTLLQKESGLTLAGALSLAKGYARNSIDLQYDFYDSFRENPEYACRKLLSERHDFEKQVILGPETTLLSVQGLLGNEPFAEAIQTVRGKSELTNLGAKAKVKEHKDYNALVRDRFKKLLHDIEESQGPTTIILDVHGAKEGVGDRFSNVHWESLADAFLRRFDKYFSQYGEKAFQEAFKDVIVLPLSCDGNDFMFTSGFRHKIYIKMREKYVSLPKHSGPYTGPSMFTLPRAVTPGQPGAALSFEASDALVQGMEEMLDRKDHIDGSDMLGFEPKLCTYGLDMSVSGTTGSILYEISQNKTIDDSSEKMA